MEPQWRSYQAALLLSGGLGLSVVLDGDSSVHSGLISSDRAHSLGDLLLDLGAVHDGQTQLLTNELVDLLDSGLLPASRRSLRIKIAL